VTCINGNVANELKVGSISNHPGGEKGAPEWTRFRNLTQPTLPINPPLGDGFEWSLISHMALNTLSLMDTRNLQGIIDLYEWRHDRANRRRIQGLQSVSCEPREIFSRGVVYRGIEVKIEVRPDHFEEDLGDLHLFGLVLNEFLSMYASINSNVQLTFLRYPDKERLFTWIPKQGMSFQI
jgi:type VI secretion system protein ImpG